MAIFGLPSTLKAPAASARETAKPKSLGRMPAKPVVAQDYPLTPDQPVSEVEPVTSIQPPPTPNRKISTDLSKPRLAKPASRPSKQRSEVGAPIGPRDKQTRHLPHRKTDGGPPNKSPGGADSFGRGNDIRWPFGVNVFVAPDGRRAGQVISRVLVIELLVETLLERGAEDDKVDAQTTIERLAKLRTDEGLAPVDAALLRLRALLARARGDDVSYRELRDHYHAMAKTLGFEGHLAIAWR